MIEREIKFLKTLGKGVLALFVLEAVIVVAAQALKVLCNPVVIFGIAAYCVGYYISRHNGKKEGSNSVTVVDAIVPEKEDHVND